MIKFQAIEDYSGNPKNKEFKSKGYYSTSGVYLHGELESDCGFDIVAATNCDTIDVTFADYTQKRAKLEEGIYSVNVVNANPNRECVAFIWEAKLSENFNYPYRGLIVYGDDKNAIEYAQRMYNKKSQVL